MLILLPGFSIHFLDDLRIPDIPSTPLEQEEPKWEVWKQEVSTQEVLMQVRLIILEYVLEHLQPSEIFDCSIDLACFWEITFLRKVNVLLI